MRNEETPLPLDRRRTPAASFFLLTAKGEVDILH
jgi:hypothetical protein